MAVNQVRFNGDDLINLRQDSVDEEKLTKGDTAHKKSGVGIEGKADYYAVKDEVADISSEDYIPFYDVSEKKKRKSLFSSFISKIRDYFVARQPDNKGYTIRNVSDALEIKHHNIDASKANNNVSSVIYPTMECHLDKDGRIFMRTESIVEPDGRIGWFAYVRNYDEQGNCLGQKGIKFYMDKQGKLTYEIGDMDAFRKAIHTLDFKGTPIPDNVDLNDYVTAGSYYVSDNGKAATIANMPMGKAWSGKLWVLDTDSSNRVVQMYITNWQGTGHNVHVCVRCIDDDGTAQPWCELASSDTVPNGGYAAATISGSAVTASIGNFSLVNGVMIMIRVESALPVNATLNINNTGAKTIWYYRNNPVRSGDNIRIITGVHYITLMYDSVNDVYHVVSFDISSSVTGQNYVANTSGYVVDNVFFDSNGFVLKHNIANGALMYNYYKNGNWRGDKRLIEEDQSLIYRGVRIPANSNFNDYGSIGIYYVLNQADADSMTNIPEKKSGKLIVMTLTETSSWNMQIYVTNNADSIYRRRQDNAGTWNSWVRVANDSELITHYGQQIPNNADLNNYKTEGVYNIASNDRANTILNIPTKLAGKLTVMSIAGSLYATQFYITYAADNSSDSFTVARSYNIFYRTYDNYNNNNKWTTWRQLTLDRDLSALMTATGKNLLPSWSYGYPSHTTNGITFTFNPATGEITVNGTATDLAHCVLAGSFMNPYDLPEGEYILSGCPSGGSASSYMLKLQAASSPNSSILNFDDYGNSVRIALREHVSSYPNIGTNYYIRIAKGYTANNLVFKPMLRPAFSSDTYVPNDSFHKGNLYIGNCYTAGDVKDKVATVDGYFKLRKGVTVCVKFVNSNSYNATSDNKVTLNVNGTGAYNIYFNNGYPTGTNRTAFGYSNRYVTYVFDGGSWVWQSHGSDDNTTYTPQSLGSGYGTCSTAEATAAKVVTLSGYNLVTNGYVSVKFTNAVPANATMNINSKGAKNIWHRGANIKAYAIHAGDLATFIYDGTRYHLIGVDRDNALDIIYNYDNAAGTPNYATRDSNVLLTQFTYVRRGDIVQVACIMKFSASKTYSAGAVLFSGLPANPTGWVNVEVKNVSFWFSSSGLHCRDSLSVTTNTIFHIGFTYIAR